VYAVSALPLTVIELAGVESPDEPAAVGPFEDWTGKEEPVAVVLLVDLD